MTASAASAVLGPTLDWGRTGYAEALRRQEELVARRIAGEVGDTLVFTEHDPVITVGVRKDASRNLLLPADELARRGIAVLPTNRGGDVTYHGPGQVVGYPLVSLAPRRDRHAYLRFLEQMMIDAVGAFGVAAGRRPGRTGIWLADRKLAAIGVAVRRWTTSHGFALNVNPDLTPFRTIVPCGIPSAEGTVTSLQLELGREVDLTAVKRELAERFWRSLPDFLSGRDGS